MQSRPSVGVGAAEALSGAYWDRRPRANSPRPTSSSSRESRHQAQTSYLSKQVFTHDATRHRPDHPGINWARPARDALRKPVGGARSLAPRAGLARDGRLGRHCKAVDRHCKAVGSTLQWSRARERALQGGADSHRRGRFRLRARTRRTRAHYGARVGADNTSGRCLVDAQGRSPVPLKQACARTGRAGRTAGPPEVAYRVASPRCPRPSSARSEKRAGRRTSSYSAASPTRT
jgi:hypothetical protein